MWRTTERMTGVNVAPDASDEPVGFTWAVEVEESGARHIRGELFEHASAEQRALFARIEAFAIAIVASFYERRSVKVAPPSDRAGLN